MPALAQSGVPPFSAFEADCRQGDQITPGCEMNIFDFYAEANNTTPNKVMCDDAALWAARDGKPADFADKPWPDAVTELVTTPGVCKVGDVPPPACPEGSPDPIILKSWSVVPDPDSGEGAKRMVFVLTNALDYDLVHVLAQVHFFDAASNPLIFQTVNQGGDMTAGADFESSTIIMGDTQVFDDPSAFTLLACTTMVVDASEIEQHF